MDSRGRPRGQERSNLPFVGAVFDEKDLLPQEMAARLLLEELLRAVPSNGRFPERRSIA
jgi:hypothetical protein